MILTGIAVEQVWYVVQKILVDTYEKFIKAQIGGDDYQSIDETPREKWNQGAWLEQEMCVCPDIVLTPLHYQSVRES